MTAYAHRERLALVDLLRETGPDAPTLCDGWTARDLTAHLLARERRTYSAVGIVVRPLAGLTEKVRRAYAGRDFAELVDELAAPPWWSPLSNPLTDELINTVEMYVHHEDVRRCRSGWEPRELPADLERVLWRRVSLLASARLRRMPVRVTLVAPGYGERSAGSGAHVHLTGPPSELLLFVSGRQAATRLDAQGPEESIEALRGANLGM
ncbi:TIGR03085 family metal-binding protein [Actinocatenispora rupis]|uniref:TIGR03085 family protein n=1 Tax=Actinocatenispora rupis TaxID=519421 RepID=A0A8J3J373_9ACTN|nr:TIGR03085 family metal-binding protein [Actinocatenispora rupis]GID09324.1 TIGR03085 family protein [Actinocatenispora rupis]